MPGNWRRRHTRHHRPCARRNNTIAVNANAPMPAGGIPVDIPSLRGATRDRYPIQLLQAGFRYCGRAELTPVVSIMTH